MKKQDIKIIHEMLQQGKTSREISLAVGIPSSTIRSHVRNHPEIYGSKPCQNCGQVMVQPIGRKVKHFCSDRCRMAWWNSHREQVQKKAYYPLVCAHCGFENGQPWRGFMLGYRYKDGQYIVVPEEAEIVRSIYADFLDGKGVTAIMKRLNKQGILTQQGFTWHKSAITRVLKNYTYTGNLLLQTKFRENHLTKRTLVNRGQLPQYHATDTHEPIIDIDTYNAVQLEMHRRAQKYGKRQTSGKYPFSGMVTCAGCGKHYRRKVTATGPVWICSTYNTLGKVACSSKAIPESTLMETAATVSATGEITAVTAHNDNTLEFTLADGTVTVKQWQDRSRASSWTPEMRAAAGEKSRERKRQYA